MCVCAEELGETSLANLALFRRYDEVVRSERTTRVCPSFHSDESSTSIVSLQNADTDVARTSINQTKETKGCSTVDH